MGKNAKHHENHSPTVPLLRTEGPVVQQQCQGGGQNSKPHVKVGCPLCVEGRSVPPHVLKENQGATPTEKARNGKINGQLQVKEVLVVEAEKGCRDLQQLPHQHHGACNRPRNSNDLTWPGSEAVATMPANNVPLNKRGAVATAGLLVL